MSAYSTIHSHLVRTTAAYQQLLATLRARVEAEAVPDGLRVAAPSSTGEFVEPLMGIGGEWLLLDVDVDALKQAKTLLGEGVKTATTPGARDVAALSMPRSTPCANGERTKDAKTWPAALTSSV